MPDERQPVIDKKREQRRLSAILAADVVGYSRLVSDDEEGTVGRIKLLRTTVIEPTIAEHNGRLFKSLGDGWLAEFSSVVQAVRCAIEIQQALDEIPPLAEPIALRVGIHVGDVLVEENDLLGDCVNVASRLESIAMPGEIFISSAVRDHLDNKLKVDFDDLGFRELKNIKRPVHVFRIQSRKTPVQSPDDLAASPITLVVLPFDNMSSEPDQQYLADGITEDITTELSRFKNVIVSARHAAFQFRGKNASLEEIARRLNVSYVVEGSVRRAGDQVRVTVQLIESKTGSHIWSEKYDTEVRNLLNMQDRAVGAIAATLEVRLISASAANARRKPTEVWSAYDCLLQGRELSNNYQEPDAVPFFLRAIEKDPNFALAHAWLAISYTITYTLTADSLMIQRALEASTRGLQLDRTDPTVNHAAAMAAMWADQLSAAGRYFDRAVALNPADLQIRADRARWLHFAGRSEEALIAIEDALQQGPFAPSWFFAIKGEILFEMGRYDQAIESLQHLPQERVRAVLFLAAAYGYLEEWNNARVAVAAAMELKPTLDLKAPAIARPSKRLLEGLQLILAHEA